MKKNIRWDDFALSFKEIWKFDKKLTFVLLIEIIINAVSPFPGILLSGLIVDNLVGAKEFFIIVLYVALLFSSNLIITSVSTLLNKAREYMVIKFINKLTNDINSKCMNIDYEQFNDSSFQDRIMLINQISQGNNFFTNISTVFQTISHIITLFGIVWIITSLNMWLLLIAVIVLVLQAILHSIRLRFNRDFKSDVIHEQRKIGYVSHLAKDIDVKKEFVMFNMGEFISKKIEMFQKNMLNFDKRRIKTSGVIEMLTYLLSVAFQVSAYLLVGFNAFTGKISIGDFSVGISSLITFMSTTSFLTSNILNYNDSIYYIRRYKSFQKLRSKYDENYSVTSKNIDLNNVEIEFRNVSFRYPNSTNYVLKNINLTIKPGERLAIVGYNGAGKTTFTLLLTRMYDPTEGAIYLNGIDIRKIDYREYQKIFATVNQDFSLLAFSLLENIAISDTATKEEESYIKSLFKNNDLAERLSKMYRGLYTPVTKVLDASGVDLSGGERQKIAIIRALYKASPVLILDEPTAALDPIAEYETYKKFIEMSENKTTVLVSHRIYSTRFCDKIAVFEKGEILEYGNYKELMDKKGRYYDFFEKQAEYFK